MSDNTNAATVQRPPKTRKPVGVREGERRRITVRLPGRLHDHVQVIGLATDQTMNDVVVDALELWARQSVQDPDVRSKVEAYLSGVTGIFEDLDRPG